MNDGILTLPRVIEKMARIDGSRVFIQEVGGDSTTYGEMHLYSGRWAQGLQMLDVKRGDNVLTMLPNTAEAIAVWNGLARIAAVEVPINTAYKGRLLQYIIDQSAAKIIVIHSEFLPRLREIWNDTIEVETIVVSDMQDVPTDLGLSAHVVGRDHVLGGMGDIKDASLGPWDPSCILFTSGTTGASKGAVMPWRLMYEIWRGLPPSEDLNSSDVFYMPLPVFHMGAKCLVMLMAIRGGCVVIRDGFDVDSFWDDIVAFQCTTTLMLGTMAATILKQTQIPDGGACLRNVLMVPLVPEAAEFRERLRVRVFTWYGLTEGGIPISSQNWDSPNPNACGQANEGYECRIVDEHDEEVPTGSVGELVIRSNRPWTMFSGYWRMPEKTAESFQNLWFHTGDAMYKDAGGYFYFVDRFKDVIRRKGENISSFELEREVDEHPAILESAAVPVRSDLGEDEIKLCIVLRRGEELTPEELLKFILTRLPHFMVPRYVEVMDALPKTSTAKIRKVELREVWVTPATWDRVAAGVRLRSLKSN